MSFIVAFYSILRSFWRHWLVDPMGGGGVGVGHLSLPRPKIYTYLLCYVQNTNKLLGRKVCANPSFKLPGREIWRVFWNPRDCFFFFLSGEYDPPARHFGNVSDTASCDLCVQHKVKRPTGDESPWTRHAVNDIPIFQHTTQAFRYTTPYRIRAKEFHRNSPLIFLHWMTCTLHTALVPWHSLWPYRNYNPSHRCRQRLAATLPIGWLPAAISDRVARHWGPRGGGGQRVRCRLPALISRPAVSSRRLSTGGYRCEYTAQCDKLPQRTRTPSCRPTSTDLPRLHEKQRTYSWTDKADTRNKR